VAEQPPYWRLISILWCTFPLTVDVAYRLHAAAYDLYRADRGVLELPADTDLILSGEVRNLKQEVALGSLVGPSFEAHVETERGKGTVRFLLTQQGLELMAERSSVAPN
jgi:hypothetical protein